ncbi:MAG: hypothetical protein HRU41_42170 [Saprospiraceae bacterium]|nr:hypothetical protein [Saprospiraceae bacterium]
MKRRIVILIFLITSFSCFATNQEDDILIFNEDTIFLQIFLLEDLNLIDNPFGATRQTAPSTACWRGYRAVWRIQDNKLYLSRIIRCESDDKKGDENLEELFKKNRVAFEAKGDMIFASWVTSDMFLMNFSKAEYSDNTYLYNGAYEKKRKKEDALKLKIVDGIVTLNSR